jgi:hypothetical protein
MPSCCNDCLQLHGRNAVRKAEIDMTLTAQQISQLSIFSDPSVQARSTAGTFELIAKSPTLIAQLQDYSAKVDRGAMLCLKIDANYSAAQFINRNQISLGLAYFSSASYGVTVIRRCRKRYTIRRNTIHGRRHTVEPRRIAQVVDGDSIEL